MLAKSGSQDNKGEELHEVGEALPEADGVLLAVVQEVA